MELTSKQKKYLDCIKRLQQLTDCVKPIDIACALGVNRATVTAMLSILEHKGLIVRKGIEVVDYNIEGEWF